MFTIRRDQLTSLADATREDVIARISAHVAELFPEVALELGGDGYEPWVRELVAAGEALDLSLEDNLRRFVEWHAMTGVESSLAERFPWSIDLLRVTSEDETLRVAAVDLRMQGRQEV